MPDVRVLGLALVLLTLSGCAGAVPWIPVIAAGISLVSTTENDATQLILHETPQQQPQPVKP